MPLGTFKKPVVPRKATLAVSKVIKQLKSDDEDLRLDTIRRLRHCALPEVLKLIVHRLLPGLKSTDEVVRRQAMEILMLLGPAGFCPDSFQSRAPGLLMLMQAEEAEDRLAALLYIGQLLQQAEVKITHQRSKLVTQVVPAVLVGLKDAEDEIRREAVKVLASMGAVGESLIDVLQIELNQQGEDLPRENVLARIVLGPKAGRCPEPQTRDLPDGDERPSAAEGRSQCE